MTKVLAAIGGGASNKVKVVDISNPYLKCDNLPDFPNNHSYAHGVLTDIDRPFICSHDAPNSQAQCFSYVNKSWVPSEVTLAADEHRIAPFPLNPMSTEMIFVVGSRKTTVWTDSRSSWRYPALPLNASIGTCLMFVDPNQFLALGGGLRKAYKAEVNGVNNFSWTEGHDLLRVRDSPLCGRIRSDRNSLEMSIIVVGGDDGQLCEYTSDLSLQKPWTLCNFGLLLLFSPLPWLDASF